MDDKRQLTMKDIARELGVSVATVSRALSDSPSISRQRRQEIQQFAREHNYFPNVIAEQLRHSRRNPSRAIGVIVPELVHYYFSSILDGIESEASSRGYQIIVAKSNESYDREVEICESMLRNKVCGIIVSQAKDTERYDHFKHLEAAGVPLVFYDRICPALNASRVVVDDYMGTMNAVSHLIETGCRRVAFYGAPMSMMIAKNRFNGYRDALYKHGLEVDESLVRICDNRADAERITPAMMHMEDRPDAFFAVNDETAIGILSVVKRMGFSVPDEVSICGFTNGFRATVCDPMLTTVEQRGSQVGKEAADILIGLVEGTLPHDHAEKRIVKTRLVVRGTTRHP
ncbi:MAG: LacI family DNA-binding transcriptional regulator [Muribaculaceae bacterium]|jgi:DNA-binding LacI/PurR family transcriptional regulator|nr:LacI family transcriptional regulator [Bacteroidales bacterium]MBR3728325.1 LacI family DNA-binding transcriptional regulator [Muribaculaceae bacterium]